MSSYQKTRRELNFQARAKAYENTLKFLAHFEVPSFPHLQNSYNYRHPRAPNLQYTLPNRFYNIFPEQQTWNRVMKKNYAQRKLAEYKRKLNANANLYKTAGSSVRYSPRSKRYVQGHPGLKKQLELLLQSVRTRPQRVTKIKSAVQSAFKYTRNYKEAHRRFNKMKS